MVEAMVGNEAGAAHCRQLMKGLVATQEAGHCEQSASGGLRRVTLSACISMDDRRHSGQHREDQRELRHRTGRGSQNREAERDRT